MQADGNDGVSLVDVVVEANTVVGRYGAQFADRNIVLEDATSTLAS